MSVNDLEAGWSKLWLPRERLKLSEWSEKNFYLSPEYSGRSGNVVLFGWQREIFDAFTDDRVRKIHLMCGTQLVKTLLIQAALAYVIAEAPGPTLLVQPKDAAAKKFSKKRLSPMLRDCAILRDLVRTGRRDKDNTIDYKAFPGGDVSLVGAISPDNLARESIQYLFLDEVDKYPASAGHEGDPIDLAIERTATYGSRVKVILTCSPTVRGRSRIGKAFEESDQRRPWVPCPKCGTFQILRWAQVRGEDGQPFGRNPEKARYYCEHCNAAWSEVGRTTACNLAEWRAEKPFAGVAGFWISHLYSPWKTLPDIAAKFRAVKDDRMRLQTWTNTTLAELWDEPGETPNYEKLHSRAEGYPFGIESAVIPRRALFLTAAVDVQPTNRCLWVEVAGWGRGRERWSIAFEKIELLENGEPISVTDRRLWDLLDEKILMRDWKHESGATLTVRVMTVDTGNAPRPVYEYAARHAQPGYGTAGLVAAYPQTVVPIKGSSIREFQQILMGVTKDDAARKRGGIRIVTVGTGAVKQEIFSYLLDGRPGPEATPNAYRFPKYERFYFEGVCSEKKVIHANGQVDWEKINPFNHPLDCMVYNRAAAAIFGVDRFSEAQWLMLEGQFPAQASAAPESMPVAEVVARERFIPRRKWFS